MTVLRAALWLCLCPIPGWPAAMDWTADPLLQARPETALDLASTRGIDVPESDIERIGRRIWLNECGGTIAGLTSWNQGEEFASLGIGHFIWYPAGYEGPFQESFPALLAYLARNGTALPDWLSGDPDCPWPDRAAFQRDIDSARMRELRDLLAATVAPQARFIVERLEAALPRILDTLPSEQRPAVSRQFYRVARVPLGVYALVDYVNFKGEGVSPTERYKGQGWGLLQVLQGMRGEGAGQAALDEFALSADEVLTRRVANSPPERHEERWLPAWRKRLQTYRTGPLLL
ncbi:MAG: hypothetical protein PHF00_09215 [Elusimicrobia bacterium]|nr:hypothetical protein [Elusimicrobiota bacterium]